MTAFHRIAALVTLAGALLGPAESLAAAARVARDVTIGRAGPAAALPVRLAPSLHAAAVAGGDETIPVWIEFADKGETGPADLAARLAEAEAALTPKARARRERAHVQPIVDYLDLPLHAPYVEGLAARGLTTYAASRWFNRVAARVPAGRLVEVASLPFVRGVEPVSFGRRTPDESVSTAMPREARPAAATRANHAINYGFTIHPMEQMQVPAVHDSGYIGTGIVVCILDEGFNFFRKHEALRNASVPTLWRRDFIQGDNNVQDTTDVDAYNHGSWVMGCIAGNKPGVYVGSAYGATFALGRTEYHYTEKPIEMVWWGMGAEWADSLGADLLTTSVGYNVFPDSAGTSYTYADMNGHTTIVTRAAEIAASKGILLVSSIGNEGNDPTWRKLVAPADVNGDSLIAVGAVDVNGVVPGFSSRGPTFDGRIKPDLCARGVMDTVVSTSGDPQGYVFGLNGTSFSAPHLAGLAACLLQARPTWTPSQVIQALRETASRANNPDTVIGYGIPNGLAALRWTPDTVGVPPLPARFLQLSVSPNPLRSDGGDALLRFALGQGASGTVPARIRVLDAQGRVVVPALWSGSLVPGQWVTQAWNGNDADGRALRSGLYFVSFEAAGRRTTVRIVSLR